MQTLPPFQTELYFAEFEFSCPHLLSSSDCQTVTVAELLKLAGQQAETVLEVPLGYSPSWGDEALRQAIASTYTALEASDILVLSSPIEGLFLLSWAVPGDTIVLVPAYDALKNLPAKVKPWSLRPTEDGWALDFEALEALATDSTELVVVNFPHNPTGFQPSPQEWERLAGWARQRDIRLFCDEMYRGLRRIGQPLLASAADLDPGFVVLGGLSKAHGLPGLRAGWLATRDSDLLRRLHDLKLYTSICAPSPIEALARVAVLAQDLLFEKNCQLVESNAALAQQFFARWPQLFRWRAPRAGSVGLVELLESPEGAEAMCYNLARRHGIVLLPSTFLGFPDRYVRLGLGRDSFPQGLAAWESVLREAL
jgi:aspartate/methionine/tyrosine aminotransferase